MIKAQIVKEDSTLEKYNIDELTSFLRTKLADLGETYRTSNIRQIKVLLGSMFPVGVAWDYSGTLNPVISPLYQAIRDFDTLGIPFGAGCGNRTRVSTLEGWRTTIIRIPPVSRRPYSTLSEKICKAIKNGATCVTP